MAKKNTYTYMNSIGNNKIIKADDIIFQPQHVVFVDYDVDTLNSVSTIIVLAENARNVHDLKQVTHSDAV